jgi:hypothetical protein
VECARPDEWDRAVHRPLRARARLLGLPEAAHTRSCEKGLDLLTCCVDRFQQGRKFAQQRLAAAPTLTRLLLAVTALLLPPVLTWHIARAAVPTSTTTTLRTVPATFALVTAWSLGEALGYLRGIPDPVPAS